MLSENLCETLAVKINSLDLKKSLGAPKFKLIGVLLRLVLPAIAPNMGCPLSRLPVISE